MTNEITAEVTDVAHGGSFVARHDGRVVFVRHAMIGETVRARITDDSKKNFLRADTVEVLQASPDRVEPVCPIAGECGGCDFQHLNENAQRRLKSSVIAEQFARLAGLDVSVEVESLGDPFGWRTRAKYRVEGDHVGMLRHRSNEIVPLPRGGCVIAHPRGRDAVTGHHPAGELDVVVADDVTVIENGRIASGSAVVTQHVGDRIFHVDARGFWQVHPRAASTLTDAVMAWVSPDVRTALDLYCGVGLFAGALVDRGINVTGVEANRTAVQHARVNVDARFIAGDTGRVLARMQKPVDLIVLDPPRTGAKRTVVEHIARLRPRQVMYIACDPAALARDVAIFADHGYCLEQLRSFDLFPMTHHMEAVALLTPVSVDA